MMYVLVFWFSLPLSFSIGSVYKCTVQWCAGDVEPDFLWCRCKLLNWYGKFALPSLPGQRTLTTLTGGINQPQSQHRYSINLHKPINVLYSSDPAYALNNKCAAGLIVSILSGYVIKILSKLFCGELNAYSLHFVCHYHTTDVCFPAVMTFLNVT